MVAFGRSNRQTTQARPAPTQVVTPTPIVDRLADISIAQYQEKYQFSRTAGADPPDLLECARLAAQKEDFPARRAYLLHQVGWLELGAEPIRLPLEMKTLRVNEGDLYMKNYRSYPQCHINADGLYTGGVELPLDIHSREFESSVGVADPYAPHANVVRHKSLYIGPLPDFARCKYKAAAARFGASRLAVVSRERRFFLIDRQETASFLKLSPLLVGFGDHGEQYLLAAWGLEHELPKSLGGLMDDSAAAK